jgi:hypothetical protein
VIRRLSSAAVLALLSVWMAMPAARAADPCPPGCTPPTPTCEQRIARARAAGCPLPVETRIVEHRVEVPVNCPQVVAPVPVVQRVEVPGPERIVQVNVPQREESYGWLVGAGPVYSAAWGVQAAVGYQWANGWQLVAGPNWIAHEGASGVVGTCDSTTAMHHGCTNIVLPYHVPEPSHLGGAALVLYRFK